MFFLNKARVYYYHYQFNWESRNHFYFFCFQQQRSKIWVIFNDIRRPQRFNAFLRTFCWPALSIRWRSSGSWSQVAFFKQRNYSLSLPKVVNLRFWKPLPCSLEEIIQWYNQKWSRRLRCKLAMFDSGFKVNNRNAHSTKTAEEKKANNKLQKCVWSMMKTRGCVMGGCNSPLWSIGKNSEL